MTTQDERIERIRGTYGQATSRTIGCVTALEDIAELDRRALRWGLTRSAVLEECRAFAMGHPDFDLSNRRAEQMVARYGERA